ncbi:sodium-dependent glucose transporter 1A-like [Amblyomma americanum]
MSQDAIRKDFADVRYQPQPDTVGQNDCVVSTKAPTTFSQLWINVGRTCNVSLGNLGMGLIMAMNGVALLDLGEIYSTSLSAASQLITTRCVGSLAGSLIGGKLYDTYNTQVISILAIALSCTTAVMIPLSRYLALAHTVIFFEGLSWGAFSTGANVWIMKMWKENSSPALQVFHLASGIGYLMAPLIARPFMSTRGSHVENATTVVANVTLTDTSDLRINALGPRNTSLADVSSRESAIYYAYGIASALQLVPAASMTVLYFIDNDSFRAQRTNSLNSAGSTVRKSAYYINFTRITLSLLCAYMFSYTAVHCTTSQMLTAFAVKCDLHFSKPSASRLVAVFFLCFAASRLAAALFAVKVSAFAVLVASHVALVTAAVVLIAWGSSSGTALWVASAVAGLSQGPLNAAVTAWVAKRINITSKMMSIVTVSAAPGFLLPPLLVGQFLDSTPNVFLYMSFAAVMVLTAVFVGMCFYLRKTSITAVNKQLVQNTIKERTDQTLSL